MSNFKQDERERATAIADEMERNVQALRRQIVNPRAWRHHVLESLQAVETDCQVMRFGIVSPHPPSIAADDDRMPFDTSTT
jgi:hypothetical protein